MKALLTGVGLALGLLSGTTLSGAAAWAADASSKVIVMANTYCAQRQTQT